MRLKPINPSLGKAETVEGVLRYEIVDAAASPRWWLRFQNLTASKADVTARQQLNDYVETLRRNDQDFEVKVNEEVTIAGESDESRILLLEKPIADGATGISGWLIVPNGRARFLTCSIIAPSATFEAVWPELRRSLQSIEVRSEEAVAADARKRMERGGDMLRFSRQQLADAIDAEPACYRIYRQTPRKDASSPPEVTELGWMVVRSGEGLRGQVDGRRPSELSGDDAQPGILVEIDAKSIVNGDPSNTVDTQIRAWLSWHRDEEVWSARNTQRQGAATRSSAQTGVRSAPRRGAPRPMLRVINSTAERQSREPEEWDVPPNYISQAELILLGRLLPKDDPAPPTFASYAYDPKSNGLPQRRDTWRRNADGTWTLETVSGGTTTPLIQVFDASGERLRRVEVDALGTTITERIELDELRRLWKSKGYPIE